MFTALVVLVVVNTAQLGVAVYHVWHRHAHRAPHGPVR
jgi:hypothetical protein